MKTIFLEIDKKPIYCLKIKHRFHNIDVFLYKILGKIKILHKYIMTNLFVSFNKRFFIYLLKFAKSLNKLNKIIAYLKKQS